jgi:hypothetical protein
MILRLIKLLKLRHHSLVITQIYLKSLGLMPNTEFASKMV